MWVPPHENHDELRCVARAGAAPPPPALAEDRVRAVGGGRAGAAKAVPELASIGLALLARDDAADGDDADVQVVAAHATRDEAAPTHDPNHALCCVAVRRGGRTRLGTAEAQILLLGAGACAAAVRRFSSLPTAGGLAGAAPKLMLRSAIAATAKDVMKSRYQQQVQLSRAALQAAAQRTSAFAELFNAATEVFDSASEIDELGERLAAALCKHTRAERVTLFLLDKKNYLNSVFATGVEGDGLHFSTRGERAGLAAVAAREDRPVRAIDAYQERSFNPVIDHETGFRTRSVLALPLHDTAGGVLGVLELLNKTALDGDAAAFTPQEQEALMVVASHCSHAIENIRLQATQLEMLQTRAQEVVRRGSCCGQEHAAAMAAAGKSKTHSGGLVVSARPPSAGAAEPPPGPSTEPGRGRARRASLF